MRIMFVLKWHSTYRIGHNSKIDGFDSQSDKEGVNRRIIVWALLFVEVSRYDGKMVR